MSKTQVLEEAARLWIEQNTRYQFVDSVPVPANIQLFIEKFCEVMGGAAGVVSESIGGMRQTFSVSSKESLYQYARELLPEWMDTGGFIPAKRRWL